MMNAESSFFSRMLFNYPLPVYLLNFRMLLSVASVILFAVCAGVGMSGGKKATQCVSSRPMYLMPSFCSEYKRVVMGSQARRKERWNCNPFLLFLSISMPLFSKLSSLLPQLVTKIMRFREWSHSSVVSYPDANEVK